MVFAQPTAFTERNEAARSCTAALSLTMPCLVDDMENSVDAAYAAWPERIFVIDTDGTIGYAGTQGPFGFEPAEMERWLRRNAGRD